jgi:3-methyladenine DNA glycosylase/8-oxoguanine DNA glycosylase
MDIKAAIRHLKKVDPVLGRHIETVGPYGLRPKNQDTFESLVQSIVYQQLRGKTAQLIHARVLALFGGEKGLTPRRLLTMSAAKLRGAGLSGNKLLALRDLAAKSLSGVVSPRKRLAGLPDSEIIARLSEVRGVGAWTVQMFLMFKLGRPDVLPVNDFGVRKAFGLLYRKSGRMPSPSFLERHGRRWAPYRTVASWYLWRRLSTLLLAVLLAAPAVSATFESLTETAGRDLAPRVRLDAAVAALAFPGGKTLEFADTFIKSEPGWEVRREFLLALATAPAHAHNPDATRLLASALDEDTSGKVRRAAADALAVRGDRIALSAARRAAAGDADKETRLAAARAVAVLTAVLKAVPKAKLRKAAAPLNEDAVKGRDPCPAPGGWCECAGAIRRPAKCLLFGDCRKLQAQLRHHDLTCLWNALDLSEGG